MVAESASVGVDVDSLRHYYRIHGLDEGEASNAAWEVGVPRFVDLFAELGISATFYCIAEDLDVEGNAERTKALVDAGHEIGNHSFHHRYDLSRLDEQTIRSEVGEARRRLSQASGMDVIGFRAPGYNINRRLISAVFGSGHRYDSSVFPCVPYYLAKASIMGWLSVRQKASQSILGSPRVLAAPRDAYRMDPGEPHRTGSSDWLQFPVAVAAGIPLIGTAFTALGLTPSLWATKAGLHLRRHLTIEFHAVDLMDIYTDDLDPALSVQPDLKVDVFQKREIFRQVLSAVADRVRVERLDILADEFLLGGRSR